MNKTILGLDCSSTCIGYAVLIDGAVANYDHRLLTGDIDAKCYLATRVVRGLMERWSPTLTIIESPVARYAKAVIPQARVSGAILAVLHEHRALWKEVAPTVGKQVLAGSGAAGKRDMAEAAALYLGIYGGTICTVKGKVCYIRDGNVIMTEDEADAIGMALAGAAMKIVVTGEVS